MGASLLQLLYSQYDNKLAFKIQLAEQSKSIWSEWCVFDVTMAEELNNTNEHTSICFAFIVIEATLLDSHSAGAMFPRGRALGNSIISGVGSHILQLSPVP